MRRIAALFIPLLILSGCGRQPRELPTIGRIQLHANGQDSTLDVKSGLLWVTARESSDPAYNYARYIFTLANFDLTRKESEEKAVKTQTAQAVSFELMGRSGSHKDTPLEVGTYSTQSGGLPKFDNLSLEVLSLADGKQVWTLSRTSPAYETHGEVKIRAVEGDTVRGEINISTANLLTVRGSFIAKRSFVQPDVRTLRIP